MAALLGVAGCTWGSEDADLAGTSDPVAAVLASAVPVVPAPAPRVAVVPARVVPVTQLAALPVATDASALAGRHATYVRRGKPVLYGSAGGICPWSRPRLARAHAVLRDPVLTIRNHWQL